MNLFTSPKHSPLYPSLPFHYHSRNDDSFVNLIPLEPAPILTVILPFDTVHAFALVSQYDKSFFLNLNITVALPPQCLLSENL
jgi:hypothetical protein